MKDFEIQVLCDDGEQHICVVVDVETYEEACGVAFQDALEAGYKPVECVHDTNWDPIKPEPLYDEKGRCVGRLMPRMTQEQLAASPGIQGWSRPVVDTRFAS